MSELKMKYFVLNPKSKSKDDVYAAASREAMRNYAINIRHINLELSQDLLDWADAETYRLMNKSSNSTGNLL
jgi:hypothetical protein